MRSFGSTVYVYDPYNRSKEYNIFSVKAFAESSKDYIVCCNVLNVIYEDDVLESILTDIQRLSDSLTEVYFQIYEGDKSGIGGETTKGWQRNEKARAYVKYIEKHFDILKIANGIIKCTRKPMTIKG